MNQPHPSDPYADPFVGPPTPEEEQRVTRDAETLQTAAGLATTHPDVPEHLRGPLSDLFRAAARNAVEVGSDPHAVALARALLDPPDSWRLGAVEHGPSETANIGGGYLCLCGAPVPCRTAGVTPEPAMRPAVRVADGLAGASAGDEAREAVRGLLGLPQTEPTRMAQRLADDRRSAEELALIEAYQRGVRAGRNEAADELEAWADRVEPIQPGTMPSRLRRTLARAVQVVAPEPTVGEVAAALVGVLDELRDRAARGERPAVAGSDTPAAGGTQ